MTLVLSFLVVVVASAAASGEITAGEAVPAVGRPPAGIGLDPFYEKYADAGGLPVVSSGRVPDQALVVAAEVVDHMLARRPDLRKVLIQGHARIAVMAWNERTTDIPEHSRLEPKTYWDERARGLGGTPFIPTTSCAEENLLGYADDRYNGECILIHEFSHAIHEIGLNVMDKEFEGRLKELRRKAMARGLWKDTYAATDDKEYWAEGVQSYFDANLPADPPNGIHNHVRTREQLQKYDPELARFIDEAFGRNPWRWSPTGAHKRKWTGKP